MHTLRQSFRDGRVATLGFYVCGLAIHSSPSPAFPSVQSRSSPSPSAFFVRHLA
ncbi:hypothetical protein ARMGADRAFT_556245 [Armillaria gallica]|uniref:Uncharacterized protein n=1 Tax=Armillaria gallica TaxID=47427 RepID=A0A2H3CR07_ARMGA|nr:hypothetical protein ARMGADRAFT_556245 [Armillaria gallica]